MNVKRIAVGIIAGVMLASTLCGCSEASRVRRNLNSYTLYVVEDISGADVDPYHYELNIIPEMVGGVKVTSKK